jgi:hypothetical protein
VQESCIWHRAGAADEETAVPSVTAAAIAAAAIMNAGFFISRLLLHLVFLLLPSDTRTGENG